MPTTVTRYVYPGADTSGDGTTNELTSGDNTHAYTSFSNAMTGEGKNLVTADEILHVLCTHGGSDSTGFISVGTGFTTDATRYIQMECTGDGHHQGVSKENGGTGFQVKGSWSGGILVIEDEAFVRLKGIEITGTGLGQRVVMNNGYDEATSDWQIDECLINNTNASTSGQAMLFDLGGPLDTNVTYTNCLFVCKQRVADQRDMPNTTWINCGFVTLGDGYGNLLDNGHTVWNSWAIGNTEDWYDSASPSGDYNASVDGTAQTIWGSTNSLDLASIAAEFNGLTDLPSTCDATLLTAGTGQLVGAGTATGAPTIDITGAARTGDMDIGPFDFPATVPACAITGTADTSLEADIVTGSKTVILTLSDDTWVAAGTGPVGSTADTQAIIDGLDAASSPTNGWNNEVRDKELTANVVRTSSTVVTITLQAASAYSITAQEVITGTIPAAALTAAGEVVCDNTIAINADLQAFVTGTVTDSVDEDDMVTGSKTLIITLEGTTWNAVGTGPIGTTANTQAIIDGLDAALDPATGWNAEIRDKELTANVVRTSNYICTITFQAAAAYDIAANETITVTVPAEAIGGASPITGDVTFSVATTDVAAEGTGRPRCIINLSGTIRR